MTHLDFLSSKHLESLENINYGFLPLDGEGTPIFHVVVTMAGHLSTRGKSTGLDPGDGVPASALATQRFLGKFLNWRLGFILLKVGEI